MNIGFKYKGITTSFQIIPILFPDKFMTMLHYNLIDLVKHFQSEQGYVIF